MKDPDQNAKSAREREAALFQAVTQLTGPDRAAFLDRACGSDAALRQRLEALLAAHEQTEGVLAESTLADQETMKVELADIPDETVGQKIGHYKILEKVGEGGCGVVYVAEQTEPVRRRVALKVIKLGMDTKQVVARFEAERQALAMMDHPNIAKVLDAGTTETGRPYFIMDLVRGIKMTDYCDQSNLPTRERLELFIQVCQAIQHAHQKGIHSHEHPIYSIVRRKLAVSLALQGNWDEAYEVRTAAKANGISPESMDRYVCRDVVRILLHKGRKQDALPVLEGMRSRLQKLQSEYGPHDYNTLRLALTLVETYAAVGQHEEAGRVLRDVTTNFMAALDEGLSMNPERMNELAWELVSKADPRLRAPEFALELATRTVDAAPMDGDYWNTLGVAHYRVGNYAEAAEALEKAAGFQAKGHRFDGFFMAMAQWKLGHKKEAHQHYDEAVNWMTNNKPASEELLRFRAEAATLLGIKDVTAVNKSEATGENKTR